MSLINDMLRDLDSRNAASSERNGLAHNIRALPPQRERRLHPLLLVLLAASAGGAVVWLLQKPAASPPAAPLAVEPVIRVTAAAPTTEITSPPATEAPPALAVPVPQAPPLRLDTQLEQVPSPAARTAPTVAAAPPTAAPAPASKPLPPASAATRATEPVNLNPAAPKISKQPALGDSPAEQAEADYRRGIAAIRRGDNSEAGEALKSALRLWPTHSGARQALLGQLTEQQRWQDAETLALDGVGLLPQRSDWALLAARLMYERGEAEQALETLNQHAAAARQNADYQIMHALLLQRAGRHAEAVSCYRTALALRPGEGRWWFGLGRALDADRREAEARQAYEKARESGNLSPELQQSMERRLRQP